MFSQGIRWSGLIVKLCGCDVQALQMELTVDEAADGLWRSCRPLHSTIRQAATLVEIGRPDKEGEGGSPGCATPSRPRRIQLALCTKSVSAFADPLRDLIFDGLVWIRDRRLRCRL
jgi:hypothetical protein